MFGTGQLAEKLLKLQKQTDEQRRIIAWLSFRYLLEKLPLEGGSDCSTVKWHKFWDSIWDVRGDSENTKLRNLVKKYKNKGPSGKEYGLDHVNEIAKGMYTTLSTNIHKYSGGAVGLSELPFDQEVRDILDFLMPEAGLNVNLDWDAERKRLGYIAEKKDNEEKEKGGEEHAEVPEWSFKSVSSHCEG
jgi:hypothetical protein